MISVVIPARNEERYIAACLESLQAQDYPGQFEIIVVANASTDGTADIARRFNVATIICPRCGVAYARQRGAESAKGDVVAQADADTVYPKDWLSRIDAIFKANPAAVAVGGSYHYIDPPWWAPAEYFLRVFAIIASHRLFGRPMLISGANFAFNKEALERIGGYQKEIFGADQYDLASRLSTRGKVVIDRRLLVYTSARRVQKPLLVIILDFGVNIGRMLLLPFKALGKALRDAWRRPRWRVAIRIFLPLFLLMTLLAWGILHQDADFSSQGISAITGYL